MQFHEDMLWKNKEEISLLFHVNFFYSFFIIIQNFELLIELKLLSSLLCDDNSIS